jgi:hypothetical protein
VETADKKDSRVARFFCILAAHTHTHSYALHYFSLEHEKGKDERKGEIAKNETASKSFAEYHKDLRHSVQKMGEILCTMQVKLHIFPRNFSKPKLAG